MGASFYFGGGSSETSATPLSLAILLAAAILICVLPRNRVIIPVLLAAMMLPSGQSLVIAGVHFMPARLVAIAGWVRILAEKLISGKRLFAIPLNAIDSACSWGFVFGAAAFITAWAEMPAVINQCGGLLGTVVLFLLLRALIEDESSVRAAFGCLAVVCILNSVEMAYELQRGQNLFGTYLGGVSPVSAVRDGRIRAQGVFGHAILAGTFGATCMPLFAFLWNYKAKFLALAGAAASLVMIYTSASSTPVLGLLAAAIALPCWTIRKNMRLIRIGIVCFLIMAQLFMNAPVWFLIARMDVIGSSSGYHRAMLVDVFFNHLPDWWLVGTRDRGDWGWDMWDVDNEYVAKGEGGGLITLFLFLALLTRLFRQLGNTRKLVPDDRKSQWGLWLLGSALFSHVISFFGASYWDQNQVSWLAFIAVICAFTSIVSNKTAAEPLPETAPVESEWKWAALAAAERG